MSIAGIRSNRGDIYQTLVAFDWALSVLSDPAFQWLEIDSTTFLVDDVVIGKSNGEVICCQCKKNQADFAAWSISDLAGEIDKASLALARNKHAKVRFYSRSEFGALAKLREYGATYGNEAEYYSNLTQEHEKTDAVLAARIATQALGLSTYQFLRRTSFEITHDFSRMEELLRGRLRQLATNSEAAFNTLWKCLNNLGGRIEDGNLSASAQHRLTKDDLNEILHRTGALLVPIMSIAQVRTSFSSTSAIGRAWVRDIAGRRISSAILNDVLAAIDAGKRSILVTGLPGSGKTCVMLNVQEELEKRAQNKADVVPLFIQSREFADLATAQERQAQGLPEKWVEQAARLAEKTHVVVVIDSLDVLSIAREHSVLKYFLAQIDRLLFLTNITIITACRDFDRRYDHRIAARQWDCELKCRPLEWETEINPLLQELGIDTSIVDDVTRELIRNPRELALFVELAELNGSFNVVTREALAQRYLDTVLQADPLGEPAMQAIESIADVMLQSRSLAVPRQRFTASQDILRRLHSLNVLQDTHDGKLTFGHQTLLDVLVICGALRRGISLNEFIKELPPVPFVRPSIRSFVAQLATGDRREFRKQVRAVLTGQAAFHIRRLVAESLAQQIPHDDDWPLLRELRDKHPEVFQVVYAQGVRLEWHHFWLSHLVPSLKESRDREGITAHVYQVVRWKNQDAAGVLAFWMWSLGEDWLDTERIADQLVYYVSDFETKNLTLLLPLLNWLITRRKPGHRFLGDVIARCVVAGAVDDKILWKYIAGDITKDDVLSYGLGEKLHCQPHEFGDKNDNFLKQRMVQSVVLLDLAIATIEEWSEIQTTQYGNTRIGYHHGYLGSTSYDDVHSKRDLRHIDGKRVLFDAIEAAVLSHAQKHSDWWEENRDLISFNHEGALCYFAILAYTKYPHANLDLIGNLLCDRNLLESDLSYELGSLIEATFILLDGETQDAVMTTVLAVWEDSVTDERTHFWALKNRAEYVSAIPCYLRSLQAQAIIDGYEEVSGKLIRQPYIGSRGGMVAPPFSFKVFLRASDDGILRLLAHYTGYTRDFDDFLVGGGREVGCQLREASSRHPSRFLTLLVANWVHLSEDFRNEIMYGISTYLAHRYGNLRTNGTWVPVEEPDAPVLASQILNELERHPSHWELNPAAAKALEACANVITDSDSAGKLVFLAIRFSYFREESTIQGDSVDAIMTGINMMTGNVAEALTILAYNLQKTSTVFPPLLEPTLRRFASYDHPGIRALILRRLPYLQSENSNLWWDLFYLTMQDSVGLWEYAERALYYAYYDHFDKIAPLLERVRQEGSKNDMEIWGRISALSALAGHIEIHNLLTELEHLDITEAWEGAAKVWTHPSNIKKYRDSCFACIEAGLKANTNHAMAVAKVTDNMFQDVTPPISVPIQIVTLCFGVFENSNEAKDHRLFWFAKWLNATSQSDPDLALAAVEIYMAYSSGAERYLYDHENSLVQLMTRLFAEAEEREESDNGTMLARVVNVQDLMLTLGVHSIDNWLKAAERQ
ncbi:hypothetical protein GMSM_19700 [Geomonas sp. Red276]